MADMVYLLADEIAAHTMLLLLPPLGHLDSIAGAALHAWAKLLWCSSSKCSWPLFGCCYLAIASGVDRVPLSSAQLLPARTIECCRAGQQYRSGYGLQPGREPR
ncbi:hypothetical protein FW789_19360 [Pseudomonas sp. 1121_17]